MSREIKFRAWNARSGMTFFDLGETLPEPVHNYYIGQYTGLKDKNGVEIYEDDIVTISYTKDGMTSKATSAPLNMSDPFNYAAVINELKRWIDCRDAYIEVIGNIHEHPELIKQ